MNEKEIKALLINELDESKIPNVKYQALEKVQNKSTIARHPVRWSFIFASPVLAAGIALAIAIPLVNKSSSGNGGVSPIVVKALESDKADVAFNVKSAYSALSVIAPSSVNSNELSRGKFDPEPPQEQEDVDYTSEVEGFFTVLNPYMPTVSSLLTGEEIKADIYASEVEGYDYQLNDLVFNVVEGEKEGFYTISGYIIDTEITVSGGKYESERNGESVSALLLNFTYSENKYLSFAHIHYESSRTFYDYFSDDEWNRNEEPEDLEDEASFTIEESLNYYEYALYEDERLTSFVGIDSYAFNGDSRVYIELNVPSEEEGYVNANADFRLDRDNKVMGQFDLIKDCSTDSGFADDMPWEFDDGHHHEGPGGPGRMPPSFGRSFRIRGHFTFSETEESYVYDYSLRGSCSYQDGHHFDGHGHGYHEDLEEQDQNQSQFVITK